MTLTKEAVSERRNELQQKYAELKQQQFQIGLQIEAHHGAVQDCDYWIQQLAAEEPKPEEKPADPGNPAGLGVVPAPPGKS